MDINKNNKLYNSTKDGLSNELHSFDKMKGYCHE